MNVPVLHTVFSSGCIQIFYNSSDCVDKYNSTMDKWDPFIWMSLKSLPISPIHGWINLFKWMKYVHLRLKKWLQKCAMYMVNKNGKSQIFKTIVLFSNNYNCAQHVKDYSVIWYFKFQYNLWSIVHKLWCSNISWHKKWATSH